MLIQMSNGILTILYSFYFIALNSLVIFTSLKLWRLHHVITYLSFQKIYFQKILIMDCIFFIIDTPMFEVISRTMLCLFVLIAFICNLIFLSLKLLKRHHSFLFLLNMPISFNIQMPNEVLTVRCCLVSVTLTRLVTFTYLQL